MTSRIDTNELSALYPIARANNDSKGFRDNFRTIKDNLDIAAAEITELQNRIIPEPVPQVNSDWNATEGVAQILNKPTILTVSDLIDDSVISLTVTWSSDKIDKAIKAAIDMIPPPDTGCDCIVCEESDLGRIFVGDNVRIQAGKAGYWVATQSYTVISKEQLSSGGGELPA